MIKVTPLQSQLKDLKEKEEELKRINRQSEMNRILQDCIKKVESVGETVLPIHPKVNVNKKLRSTLGYCKCYDKPVEIDVSEITFELSPMSAIEDTIMHEVIHAVPDCDNHGEKWKTVADKINKKYGYNIKRTANLADMGISKDVFYKYLIICKNCGEIHYRQKKINPKSIQIYGCTKCGKYGTLTQKENANYYYYKKK